MFVNYLTIPNKLARLGQPLALNGDRVPDGREWRPSSVVTNPKSLSPGRFGGVKRAPRGNSMGQMGQRVRQG
jgi:hypothetical protein